MKYTVNVHVGTVLQVEIEANSEDEAEVLAILKIEKELAADTSYILTDLATIDAEVIGNPTQIKCQELSTLDEKLIIKGE